MTLGSMKCLFQLDDLSDLTKNKMPNFLDFAPKWLQQAVNQNADPDQVCFDGIIGYLIV